MFVSFHVFSLISWTDFRSKMPKRKKDTPFADPKLEDDKLDDTDGGSTSGFVRRSTRSQVAKKTSDDVAATSVPKKRTKTVKTDSSQLEPKVSKRAAVKRITSPEVSSKTTKNGDVSQNTGRVRGSRYFERFKNKLIQGEPSTSRSGFESKETASTSKEEPTRSVNSTKAGIRNARSNRSPYFTSESGVQSMDTESEESDSDDNFEEVESRELDPFELLEREQQQSQDGLEDKAKKKSKKSTAQDSKFKKPRHDDLEEVDLENFDEDDALDRHKPSLPQEGIQVELEHPLVKRKEKDREEIKRMRMNRMKKWMQENVHKAHFLSLVARGLYLNRITIDQMVQGLCLSHVAFFYDGLQLTPKKSDFRRSRGKKNDEELSLINMNPPTIGFLKEFVRRFKESFSLDLHEESTRDEFSQLIDCLKDKKALTSRQFTLAFISFLRVFRLRYNINVQVRLVQAMTPLPIKPKDLLPSDKQIEQRKGKKKPSSSKESKAKKSNSSDSIDNLSDDDSSNEDEVVEESEAASKTNTPKARKKKNDFIPCDVWSEVFLTTESRWIPVDPVNQLVDDVDKFESVAEGAVTSEESSPVHYFLSFDDEGHVKECSNRYASKFLTGAFNRPRVDSDWLEKALTPFRPKILSQQEMEEDQQINQLLADRPLPKTVSDFKGHPLVVLQRHILVYEAIYPPDSQPIGYFRKEGIYSRQCIKPVRSELYWKRQARVLKEGVSPYKTVKGRKRWDRFAEKYITDLPNELYGLWQTDPYEPPVAVNGKVPRNEFGNVELFQPCMLPIGTVHLNVPGLARIAAKLGIDCVAAVTGFENANRRVVPTIEGFVVCEEYKEVLLDAFREEKRMEKEKIAAKRLATVYANWRRLTRALIVREKLNAKYGDN